MLEKLLLSLVQVSLISAAVILPLLLVRAALRKRYPAAMLCLVWAVLAVRLLVPVQLAPEQAPITVRPATSHVVYQPDSAEHYAVTEGFAANEGLHTWVTSGEGHTAQNKMSVKYVMPWGEVLALMWLAVALVLAAFQAAAYARFKRRALCAGHEADAIMQAALLEAREALGVRRDIRLCVTPAVSGPMLAGLFSPVLLLTEQAMSEVEARFVFRHELTHYKRGDLFLKLLLAAAGTLHWFNPLVYLMVRAAGEDIELACDSAVVLGMDAAERRAYGLTILKSAAGQTGARQALTTRFTSGKESLRARLAGLFDETVKKRGMALLLVVAMTLGILGGGFAIRTDAGAVKEDTEALMRAAIENYVQGTTEGEETKASAYVVQSLNTVTKKATIIYNMHWKDSRAPDYRAAEEVTLFRSNTGDGYGVSGPGFTEYKTIESAQDFAFLYGNDMGLPMFDEIYYPDLYDNPEVDRYEQWGLNVVDEDMTVKLFGLAGGRMEAGNVADFEAHGATVAMQEKRYLFADGSSIRFAGGGVPRDWCFEDGSNNRTPIDLANQWAHGMFYKSGGIRFDILSNSERDKFIAAKLEESGDGNIYWKIGGSSPSVRRWTVIPGENSARIVYAEWDSTPHEYRYDENLTFGKDENGKTVVTGTDQGYGYIPNDSVMYADSVDKFLRLYDNKLGMPAYDADRLVVLKNKHDEALRNQDGYEDIAAADYLMNLENTKLIHTESGGESDAITLTYQFTQDNRTLTVETQPISLSQDKTIWMPTGWRLSSGEAGGSFVPYPGAETSTHYENARLDIALDLPESWSGRYILEERGKEVAFRQAERGNVDGVLMWLQMLPAEEMHANYGESAADIESSYPVPMRVLGEREGKLYCLIFPSDVQFDISSSAAWAEYNALARAGHALSFGFLSDRAADGVVDSLQAFVKRYASGVGLPDYTDKVDIWSEKSVKAYKDAYHFDLTEPVDAATAFLNLSGGKATGMQDYYAEDKLAGKIVTYAFPDGSVHIVMVNQYDVVYLPQNWYLEDGANSRTSSDLAKQWARGVSEKSGQYLYPILSEAGQQKFVQEQKDKAAGDPEEGAWYWKYGGSSPSYRDYVMLDTSDEDTKRIVYQMYGGGVDDSRGMEDITIGHESGRAVIAKVKPVDTDAMTEMERFALLYGSGLPLPTFDMESLDAFLAQHEDNGRSYLREPNQAALSMFWLENRVDAVMGGSSSRDGADWEISVHFIDGSGEIKIYMYQPEGYPYWLPISWESKSASPDITRIKTSEEVNYGVPSLEYTEIVYTDGTYVKRSENGTGYVMNADIEARIAYKGKVNRVSVTYTDSAHKQLLAEREVAPSLWEQELVLPLTTPPGKDGWLVFTAGFTDKNGITEANEQIVHVIWQ